MNSLFFFAKNKYLVVACMCLMIFSIAAMFWGNRQTQAEPAAKEVLLSSKKYFFHMQGQIKNRKEKFSKTTIEIFYSDSASRYSKLESDGKGLCNFQLPLQNYFLIKFMKYGYITKKITVDTHVPEKMIEDYYCEFNGEMFPQIPEVDAAPLLKEPVANFFFDQKSHNFDYDRNTSDSINRLIKVKYSQYYFPMENENMASKKNKRTIPAPLR